MTVTDRNTGQDGWFGWLKALLDKLRGRPPAREYAMALASDPRRARTGRPGAGRRRPETL